MFNVLDFDEMKETVLSDEDAVFYIPRKVKEINRNGKKIDIHCEGWEYRRGIMDIWFNQLNPNLTPDGEKFNMIIRLELKTDEIVRLRLIKGDEIEERTTPMVVEDFSDVEVNYDYQEEDDEILIKTDKLNITVEKNPVNVGIEDKEGQELFKQYNYDKHAINELIKFQGEAQYDYSSFECYPFGLAENLKTGKSAAFDSICLKHNENFYGLGEKFTDINKRGQEVLGWQVDALGTSTQKSYKNVPFFMSSKGYGVFLNTAYKNKFKLGDYYGKAYQMETAEGELDYYLIYGPSMKDILKRYTDITGKTPLPPKWSFGLWMSRNSYRSEEEMLETAQNLREKELPCDVLHLDADWFEEALMCDFEFDRERFPEPERLVEKLNDLGYKMSIWQLPYINENNKLYKEGVEKGYFEKGAAPSNTESFIDISNPEAREWYKGKLKNLLEMGISAIKADFGEGLEVEACYDQYRGEEFHNLFALLYNKMVFDLTEEVHGEGNALIWGRSAYAGSQRYPVHWAGDSDSDFPSLATTLKGGLSFGLSGFPFWSHDIGGYFMKPEDDCYIRWMQVGMFSSHARFHGTTPREPWHYGEQAVEIYKKFAEIRYRLMPYIYSEAYHCTEESLPLMRPLVIEYEDDPTVANIDDQYLFGTNILVAPILTSDNSRKVYLPEGSWYDFWNMEEFSGQQWIDYEAELNKMPLFIKKGSIIPEGPRMQYVDQRDYDPLTLNIYHDKEEKYEFFDDDKQFTIECREEDKTVKLNIGTVENSFKINIYGLHAADSVKINGDSTDFEFDGKWLSFDIKNSSPRELRVEIN